MRYAYIILIVCGLSCVCSRAGAYFEERFFCTVEQNIIEVSLQSGDEYCFTYIGQITTNLKDIEEDIEKADNYIDQGRDNIYWTEVGNELRTRQTDLQNLRAQMIVAIEDYEHELFLTVKSLVASYLLPKRQEVLNKISTAQKLLIRLKNDGDRSNYAFIVIQLERLQQQLILYDSIRVAGDFGTLIPPLKLYIQGGGFKLDTIEDKPDTQDIT